MMSDSEDFQEGAVNRLVARGFATRVVVDEASGYGSIAWTEAGRELRGHLAQLFEVPGTAPSALGADVILATVGLILFLEPLP